MSIEEIIERLEELRNSGLGPMGNAQRKALSDAIALLKTHPEAQPNEPLTLEELRKMDGQPVWVEIISDEKNSGWWFLRSTVEFIRLVRYPHQHFGCLFEGYGTVLRAYHRPPKEDTV